MISRHRINVLFFAVGAIALAAFLISLFGVKLWGTPERFTWNGVNGATGYFLYATGPTNSIKTDCRTNLAVLDLGPGAWTVTVSAYSTNSFDNQKVETAKSAPLTLYMTAAVTGLDAPNVDHPFQVPVYPLASNAVMRATVYLQWSGNLVSWSEGVPIAQYDLNDGTNGFYRTRLVGEKLGP